MATTRDKITVYKGVKKRGREGERGREGRKEGGREGVEGGRGGREGGREGRERGSERGREREGEGERERERTQNMHFPPSLFYLVFLFLRVQIWQQIDILC